MISYFRRHHKKILVVLVILVVPAFVFWGGSFGKASQDADAENRAMEPIARVNGNPIPAAAFSQQLNAQLAQMQRMNPKATRESMTEEQIEALLDGLVDQYLLQDDVTRLELPVEKGALTNLLKEDPFFQDDNGQLDRERWNDWVQEREDENWNAVYADLRLRVKQDILIAEAAAAARVLDADVRRRFEQDRTELSVRYVAVAPEVEPTEEQLREEYEANPERYENPEEMKAAFVAFSLKGERPALVDEIMGKLQAGADFAELAKQHSDGSQVEQGGDMGWRRERPNVEDHLAPMFATPPGEFSEPVEGPQGWYIYAVEDERNDEQTGQREVKVRQILINSKLEGEALNARKAEAQAFAAAARESGSLEAAANEAGRALKTTDFFTTRSFEIENIPRRDAYAFRTALADIAMDAVSDVIEAGENLYVAQLTEVKPATPKPLEEVRTELEAAVERQIQRSPEYAEKLEALEEEIAERADSLADIVAMFPEKKLEVEQADPFTVADFRFSGRPLWMPREVFEAVGHGQPGAFGGPITHPAGIEAYYVELLAKTPPEQNEDLESQWEEQKDQVRSQLENEARQARLRDYFLAKRMRSAVAVDEKLLDQILGREVPEEEADEAAAAVESSEAAMDEAQKEAAEATASQAMEEAGGEALPEATGEPPTDPPTE